MNNIVITENAKNFEGKRGEFVMGGFPMFVEDGRQEYFLEVVDVGGHYDESDDDSPSSRPTPIRINMQRLLQERENPYESKNLGDTEGASKAP